MPLSVLRKLLQKVEKEINTNKEHLKFYKDGSFIIKNYTFDEFEEEIEKKNKDLEVLERVYKEFLESENLSDKIEPDSIFKFVELNKLSLGKYINKKYQVLNDEETIEARFVNFIRAIPALYETFQSVYIGSIISTYLEYEPSSIKTNVELVFDTNFIISLLDLKTTESTYNCRQLLELGTKLGYRFTVLGITIREIDQLLNNRIENFDTTFLSRLVDPEDIYNACQRRNLTKTDLERIKNNLEKYITDFNISIVPNTEKFENKARFSDEYEKLKKIRNTDFAALHDSTCSEYVKEKRGKPIYDFEKVNCWFVNNSSSRHGNGFQKGIQPIKIQAEDLLNMLWLASPIVRKDLSASRLASIGLSRLVSTTLNDALPRAAIIKELDENIRKYANENITHEDVVRISMSIAQRTVTNLEDLNELADNDAKQFVSELQAIANAQKAQDFEYKALLNKLISDLKDSRKEVEAKKNTLDAEKHSIEAEKNSIETERNRLAEAIKENAELSRQVQQANLMRISLENQIREPKRKKLIYYKVFWWRMKPFLLVLAGIIIVLILLSYVIYKHNGDVKSSNDFIKGYTDNLIYSIPISLVWLIYSGIFVRMLGDRFNQSTINAFKSTITLPAELSEVKE